MSAAYEVDRLSIHELTVSAPGKVLLAGGYLVLEPQNIGLVVAVDKRFYTTIQVIRKRETCLGESNDLPIRVSSPQFGKTWQYSFDKTTNTLSVTKDTDGETNDFVQKTLQVLLLYLSLSPQIVEIRLTVQADNEFYSLVPHLQERNLDLSLDSCQLLDKFLPVRRVNGRIVKSGLGSSACLVTSLVAAICYALNDSHEGDHDQLSIITNLSQIAHCYAQGKVGSGFDVSAACLSSHVYRRFPKTAISDLLEQLERRDIHMRELLRKRVEEDWTAGCVVDQLSFTDCCVVQLLLADVSGGSESPGMASKVLKWKEMESDPVFWKDLENVNQRIVQLFADAVTLRVSDDERARLATSLAEDWVGNDDHNTSVGRTLYDLRQAFLEARGNLKAMGNAAGVPIEPEEQTRLADAMNLPGVVAALCPGAGGFDAIVCLYVVDRDESARQRVANFWSTWPGGEVCPLDIRGLNYGDGVKKEESATAL